MLLADRRWRRSPPQPGPGHELGRHAPIAIRARRIGPWRSVTRTIPISPVPAHRHRRLRRLSPRRSRLRRCRSRPTLWRIPSSSTVDSTIQVDVRYATANNFTGAPLPGLCPADPPARSHRLGTGDLGLRIFDGYRPVRATLAMVDWAERTGRCAPGYIAAEPPQPGVAVDLTLVDLVTGTELPMGTPFDTFSRGGAHGERRRSGAPRRSGQGHGPEGSANLPGVVALQLPGEGTMPFNPRSGVRVGTEVGGRTFRDRGRAGAKSTGDPGDR